MKSLRTIIVDDERKARENLWRLLEIHCPEVEVLAMCQDVVEAKIAILEKAPDLVFLDIKMPGETGLDLLKSLPRKDFLVVFVTAYSEHAVEAFEEEAVDYLMKPILSARLKKAVSRVIERHQQKQPVADLSVVKSPQDTKIAIPTGEGLELYDPDDILRFQASGSYTEVHFISGDNLLISRNLKKMEELVNNRKFVRVHHAHLVNLKHIQKYTRKDGGFLILNEGTEVEVSRRKKNELLMLLGNTV